MWQNYWQPTILVYMQYESVYGAVTTRLRLQSSKVLIYQYCTAVPARYTGNLSDRSFHYVMEIFSKLGKKKEVSNE